MEKLIAKIFDSGAKIGLHNIECYALWGEGTNIEIKEQKIENLKISSFKNLSIRAIKSGKMGISYLYEFNENAIKFTLENLSKIIEYLDKDECFVLPTRYNSYPAVKCYDDTFDKISLDDKTTIGMKMEEIAHSYDKLIKKVRYVIYQDSKTNHLIKNTHGLCCNWQSTGFSCSTMAVAEKNGNAESGWDSESTRYFSNLAYKKVAQRAAEDAVSMLGAHPIPTKTMAIILSPKVAANFLEFLINLTYGEMIVKKKSLLINKLGDEVISNCINIIDDGTMPWGIGTSPGDDEGTPKAKNIIIQNGILKSYLHNTYTAAKLNTKNTGNAYKTTIKSLPKVNVSNCFISPSADKYSGSTINSIDKNGFYAAEVMGLHTANPISGDFSVGVSGFTIINGKKAEPVRGIAFADNILSIFKKIQLIGHDDMRWFGKIGSPSLLIDKITISGE